MRGGLWAWCVSELLWRGWEGWPPSSELLTHTHTHLQRIGNQSMLKSPGLHNACLISPDTLLAPIFPVRILSWSSIFVFFFFAPSIVRSDISRSAPPHLPPASSTSVHPPTQETLFHWAFHLSRPSTVSFFSSRLTRAGTCSNSSARFTFCIKYIPFKLFPAPVSNFRS